MAGWRWSISGIVIANVLDLAFLSRLTDVSLPVKLERWMLSDIRRGFSSFAIKTAFLTSS